MVLEHNIQTKFLYLLLSIISLVFLIKIVLVVNGIFMKGNIDAIALLTFLTIHLFLSFLNGVLAFGIYKKKSWAFKWTFVIYLISIFKISSANFYFNINMGISYSIGFNIGDIAIKLNLVGLIISLISLKAIFDIKNAKIKNP